MLDLSPVFSLKFHSRKIRTKLLKVIIFVQTLHYLKVFFMVYFHKKVNEAISLVYK